MGGTYIYKAGANYRGNRDPIYTRRELTTGQTGILDEQSGRVWQGLIHVVRGVVFIWEGLVVVGLLR